MLKILKKYFRRPLTKTEQLERQGFYPRRSIEGSPANREELADLLKSTLEDMDRLGKDLFSGDAGLYEIYICEGKQGFGIYYRTSKWFYQRGC